MKTEFRQTVLAVLASLSLVAATTTAMAQATAPAAAGAISDGVVKIGLLEDMTSLYSVYSGSGSVEAAKMAAEDFGGKVRGVPIEIVAADHQNKPDLSATKAREWFDRSGVDMLANVAGTATAMAALKVAVEKRKIVTMSAPGSLRLTNEDCSPLSAHWTYDSHALAATVGRGVIQAGGDTWFFLLVDNVYGTSLLESTSEVIKAAGGKVVGSVRHPINASDFSSFMLQAKASKAKVVGLGNAGGDTVSAIRSFKEFGLGQDQRLVGTLMFVNDIHAVGLAQTQGMLLAESFYWDMNDATRKWSRRYFERMKQMPNGVQAGVYSAVTHYLRGVQATGTDKSEPVMAWMRANPVNDFFAPGARIREDGRLMKPMYLFEVKKPEESKTPWDYYKLKATVPATDAFQSLDKSTCPLVKKR